MFILWPSIHSTATRHRHGLSTPSYLSRYAISNMLHTEALTKPSMQHSLIHHSRMVAHSTLQEKRETKLLCVFNVHICFFSAQRCAVVVVVSNECLTPCNLHFVDRFGSVCGVNFLCVWNWQRIERKDKTRRDTTSKSITPFQMNATTCFNNLFILLLSALTGHFSFCYFDFISFVRS